MKKSLLFIFSILCHFSLLAQTDWSQVDMNAWTEAANNGDARAQYVVAIYNLQVQNDIQLFKSWLEKSVNQGYSDAQVLIAQLYAIGDYGFPQDNSKAIDYVRKAAGQNNIEAQMKLWEAYRKGLLGIEKNDDMAIYWAGRAADQGNDVAQYALGLAYLAGKGCRQNEAMALDWLGKSAAQNNIDAQCVLIDYYGHKYLESTINLQPVEQYVNNLISIGLDFLINPAISENSPQILAAKGVVGWGLITKENYKKGIPLLREGLASQDPFVLELWELVKGFAEFKHTTLSALERQ